MLKRSLCEEVFKLDGKTYVFRATIGNVEAFSFECGDPYRFYNELVAQDLPPTKIRVLIEACVHSIDGEILKDEEKSLVSEDFINKAGLQDSSVVCRSVLTTAVIGDIKKKSINRKTTAKQAIQSMRRVLRLSTLMSFGRSGLLWVTTLAALAIFASANFYFT